MAQKKSQDEAIAEIKDAIDKKVLVIGTDKSIALIQNNKAKCVFLSQNCPKKIVNDISHVAGLSGIEVFKISQPNDELGTICRKPFSISVVSIKKE